MDITKNEDGSTAYEGLWEEVGEYAREHLEEFAGRRVTLTAYTEEKAEAEAPAPDASGE